MHQTVLPMPKSSAYWTTDWEILEASTRQATTTILMKKNVQHIKMQYFGGWKNPPSWAHVILQEVTSYMPQYVRWTFSTSFYVNIYKYRRSCLKYFFRTPDMTSYFPLVFFSKTMRHRGTVIRTFSMHSKLGI